jgi:branched-chain amino acid transport system substrate-binding protein
MLAAARLAGLVALLAAANAAAEVRIAFVGALSGPAAWAGRDQRDAFALALAQRNGSLGGIAVRFGEIDDAADPRRAPAIAKRLLAEKVQIVTGLTGAASALALSDRLRGKPLLILSSGAAPLRLAGKGCSARFFSTAAPDDAIHENAGAMARNRRYATVQVIGDKSTQRAQAEAAFRRTYKGKVAWHSLQGDAATAIRQIRASSPDAVYLALDTETIVEFLEAYAKVGLFHRIPIIAAGVEPPVLQALGPDFSGLIVSVRWAASLENQGSAQFAEAFKAQYGRTASSYAMQSYDAALALDQALATAKTPSAARLAGTLAASKAEGVAQPIHFAANGFAATEWRAWEVFNESSGAPYLAAGERTLRQYTGPHLAHCQPS